MQPAVGVHGHRLPAVLLHVRGLGGLLQELQQALDPHGAAHTGPGKPEAFAGPAAPPSPMPPEDPGGCLGSPGGDKTAPTAASPGRRSLAAGGKGRPRRCPRGGRTELLSSARSALRPALPAADYSPRHAPRGVGVAAIWRRGSGTERVMGLWGGSGGAVAAALRDAACLRLEKSTGSVPQMLGHCSAQYVFFVLFILAVWSRV